MSAIRELDRSTFAWREGSDGRPFLDLLLGSDRPRRALDAGADVGEVAADWTGEADAFAQRRRPFLLYD